MGQHAAVECATPTFRCYQRTAAQRWTLADILLGHLVSRRHSGICPESAAPRLPGASEWRVDWDWSQWPDGWCVPRPLCRRWSTSGNWHQCLSLRRPPIPARGASASCGRETGEPLHPLAVVALHWVPEVTGFSERQHPPFGVVELAVWRAQAGSPAAGCSSHFSGVAARDHTVNWGRRLQRTPSAAARTQRGELLPRKPTPARGPDHPLRRAGLSPSSDPP
jgi:hypothetical protein